jgi:hypothetical protein
MNTELMDALRDVYDEDKDGKPAVSQPAGGSKRSINYDKIRKLRLVWDRRQDKSLPFNFSFVVPGKIAGMALPTSQEQLLTIAKEHSIGSPPLCLIFFSWPAQSLIQTLFFTPQDLFAP